MRHRLRVLLTGSAIALAISVVTMIAYALSTGSSGPSSGRGAITSSNAGAQHGTGALSGVPAGPVTDSEQVCNMVTRGEAYWLLYTYGGNEPGTPLPMIRGGACTWGTGFGETFTVTVVPRSPGAGTQPCSGLDGTVVRADGWVGCNRLQFGPGINVLRAFKGSFVVSIEPGVNVIGPQYVATEESTITHVFGELGA